MKTIDEIRIEGDEDGFHLVIWDDDGGQHRFRVGMPDQFRAEVERTIGAWLAEGERAARQWQIDRGGAPDSRHADYGEPWPGQNNLVELIDSGAADLMRDHARGK